MIENPEIYATYGNYLNPIISFESGNYLNLECRFILNDELQQQLVREIDGELGIAIDNEI
jgi:hypothetical protein